jgi:membrane peptidoglycan carboxypeptidase
VNTIFAQLIAKVGVRNVKLWAHRLGITSSGSYFKTVCAMTLGSVGFTPLEMTDVYATFASGGVHHAPQAFESVREPNGRLVKLNANGRRILGPNVAAELTYALQGVIQHGTGTAAAIARPAAGKTGTAENFQDAWFCGYVPQLATCVWVGYPSGEIPLLNVEGVSEVFGGTLPAQIWHEFMGRQSPTSRLSTSRRRSFSARRSTATARTPRSPPRAPGDSPGHAGQDAAVASHPLNRVDDLVGETLERAIRAHHVRRLRRHGSAQALDPTVGGWAGTASFSPRPGCRIELLADGSEALARIADAIRSARSPVHLAGWHFDHSFRLEREGPTLRELLADAADRVAVRVLAWAGAPLPLFHPRVARCGRRAGARRRYADLAGARRASGRSTAITRSSWSSTTRSRSSADRPDRLRRRSVRLDRAPAP